MKIVEEPTHILISELIKEYSNIQDDAWEAYKPKEGELKTFPLTKEIRRYETELYRQLKVELTSRGYTSLDEIEEGLQYYVDGDIECGYFFNN
jgi:hypothetical protein